jgi:hypothetical protein
MNPGTATAAPPGPVREVDMPPEARALTALPQVDYEDSFIADVASAEDRTAEEWARAMLDGAPATTRRALRRGWLMLGLRLGSTRDERRVLGWEVRRSTPDVAILAGRSLIGFEGELLFKREPDGLLFATFLRLKNPIARAVWARTEPGHRRVVRHLLKRTTHLA